MMDVDESGVARGEELRHRDCWPETRLEHAFDNRMRPSEVTLFDREDKYRMTKTAWISAELDSAVPLEEIQ